MTTKGDGTDLRPKWDGDLLDRKSTADFLTKYVTKSHEKSIRTSVGTGLVIALDADWGSGKSFFINHWSNDLKLNHPVVSFDAWKNDFTPDPLLGFLAELRKDLDPHLKKIPAAKKAWSLVVRQARLSGSESKSKTVFQDLIKRHVLNPVKVKFFARSNEFRTPAAPREIAITDIVWLFHKASLENLIELRNSANQINSYDYPSSLLQQVAQEAPNPFNSNEFYACSLSNYPGLVRHAGQLVEE